MFDQCFNKHRLTPHQNIVASLIMDGLTNEEISQASGFTVPNVKFHVTNILRTFAINSRARFITVVWREYFDSEVARLCPTTESLPFGSSARQALNKR